MFPSKIKMAEEDEEYSLTEFEDDEEEISDGSRAEEREENYELKKKNGLTTYDHLSKSKGENTFRYGGDDYIKNDDFENDDTDDADNLLDNDNEIRDHVSPEVLIVKLHLESGKYLDFNSLKINKIKCMALCKILYGEHHWKTAEAHLQLAEVYLIGKLYSKQALKHSNISRDILLFLQNRGDSAASTDMQYLLQNLYLVIGKVNLQLSKYKVAENCLQKAKLVSDSTNVATDKFFSKRVEILSALGNSSSKLGKLGQGMEYLEEAIEIVSKMPTQYMNLSVKLYKQIIELEILNDEHANFTLASESAKKALDISLEINGHNSRETAEILTMISRVEALKEESNYDKVEKRIKEALEIYISIQEHEKQLAMHKMHSKILIQQEKFTEAEMVLELAITKCEEIYGDSSTQCADLFELMGSIFFAQGKMSDALSYFTKAEEIYSQKKKCMKKQQKMIKIMEMIRKSSKDEKLKSSTARLQERPRFM